MMEWIPVDDPLRPPPVGELVPIARADWPTQGEAYVQLAPRARRAPRQEWFNRQNKRIRKPDWYGVAS